MASIRVDSGNQEVHPKLPVCSLRIQHGGDLIVQLALLAPVEGRHRQTPHAEDRLLELQAAKSMDLSSHCVGDRRN
jgi:hypothetical protein